MWYVTKFLTRILVWASAMGCLAYYSATEHLVVSPFTTWFLVYYGVCAGIILGIATLPRDKY